MPPLSWLKKKSEAPSAPDSVSPGQALVLGAVQGLTEFVPVSSSAHLNLAHSLMGHRRDLNFDVMLGAGTTLALIAWLRGDLVALCTDPEQRRLRNLLLLSCLPAFGLGLWLHKYEEKPPLSEPWFNGLMLTVAGAVMWVADASGAKTRSLEELTAWDAWLVGCAQALALMPGVSRSGATLTGALACGFTRPDSARLALLMSVPVSLGALVHELPRVGKAKASPAILLLGAVAAAVTGVWSLSFLLNYLRTKSTGWFAVWRMAIGTLALLSFSSSFAE